tara:strand:- start:226 stop:561 length:336 start_codon:yes stop_codon:yes gene_type:complete
MVLPSMYSPAYHYITESRVKKTKSKVKQKLSEFEAFENDAPKMPDFTCPHIDNVNDWLYKATEEMEELRNMNSQLRDNAEFWKESCEEMQNKLDEMRDWKKTLQNIVNEDI